MVCKCHSSRTNSAKNKGNIRAGPQYQLSSRKKSRNALRSGTLRGQCLSRLRSGTCGACFIISSFSAHLIVLQSMVQSLLSTMRSRVSVQIVHDCACIEHLLVYHQFVYPNMSLIMSVRLYIWNTLHSVPDLEHPHEVRSPGTKDGHINTFQTSQVTLTSGHHGLSTKCPIQMHHDET